MGRAYVWRSSCARDHASVSPYRVGCLLSLEVCGYAHQPRSSLSYFCDGDGDREPSALDFTVYWETYTYQLIL